jgi:hypothetical protein
MLMVSNERRKYSNQMGDITAQRFVEACEAIGYSCEKSDRNTDIYDHIDYFVTRLQGTTSVDVKGGNHPNTIWVEFKNVHGNDGWLYGKAEYIAFDMPELGGFVMVRTSELARLSEQIVEPVFVTKQEATRKYYQREGRQDVISRLELTDLQRLVSFKVLHYANPQTSKW